MDLELIDNLDNMENVVNIENIENTENIKMNDNIMIMDKTPGLCLFSGCGREKEKFVLSPYNNQYYCSIHCISTNYTGRYFKYGKIYIYGNIIDYIENDVLCIMEKYINTNKKGYIINYETLDDIKKKCENAFKLLVKEKEYPFDMFYELVDKYNEKHILEEQERTNKNIEYKRRIKEERALFNEEKITLFNENKKCYKCNKDFDKCDLIHCSNTDPENKHFICIGCFEKCYSVLIFTKYCDDNYKYYDNKELLKSHEAYITFRLKNHNVCLFKDCSGSKCNGYYDYKKPLVCEQYPKYRVVYEDKEQFYRLYLKSCLENIPLVSICPSCNMSYYHNKIIAFDFICNQCSYRCCSLCKISGDEPGYIDENEKKHICYSTMIDEIKEITYDKKKYKKESEKDKIRNKCDILVNKILGDFDIFSSSVLSANRTEFYFKIEKYLYNSINKYTYSFIRDSIIKCELSRQYKFKTPLDNIFYIIETTKINSKMFSCMRHCF